MIFDYDLFIIRHKTFLKNARAVHVVSPVVFVNLNCPDDSSK